MRRIEKQPLAAYRNNGSFIDFDAECTNPGAIYEHHAYKALAANSNADFGIGPNIVNLILGCKDFQSIVKPDAILFRVVAEQLTVTTLAEFKSGKHLHLSEKVNGFSVLTQAWRNNPEFLTDKMSQLFRRRFLKDVSVYVPEDDHIEVVTVSPYLLGLPNEPVDNQTEFMVSYLRLPYDGGY